MSTLTGHVARVVPDGIPGVRDVARRQLQQVVAAPLDPDAAPGDPGLFGPDSATWQLIGEPIHVLTGLRAALLQALSPQVVAGVHNHGRFYDDFLGRIQRTAAYVQSQCLGSMDEVLRSAERARRAHTVVRGTTPKGLPYDADDPRQQAWVSMTLTDSILTVYETLGPGPVADEVADRFVAEQAIPGALLDRRVDLPAVFADPRQRAALQAGELPLPMISEGLLPRSRAELAVLMAAFTPDLAVTGLSRGQLDAVLSPPLPTSQWTVLRPFILATLHTIPDPWRGMIAPDLDARTARAAALWTQGVLAGVRAIHGPFPSVEIARRRVTTSEPGTTPEPGTTTRPHPTPDSRNHRMATRSPFPPTGPTPRPPADDRGTMLDLFLRNVDQFPAVGAIIDGDTRLTWGEYGQQSAAVALALRDLGVGKDDVVGLQQVNRHEHVVADTAALRLGATPTSFYNTLAPDQLVYVAGDCEAKVVIVDGDRVDTWLQIRDKLPALEHVVALDLPDGEAPEGVLRWEELLARGQELVTAGGMATLDEIHATLGPDDPLTIIYTSGTTGPPKGVVLTHGGLRFTVGAGIDMLRKGVTAIGQDQFGGWMRDGQVELPAGLPGLSYLPLAHIAERFISHYQAFALGTEVTYVRDLVQLPEVLPTVRPFVFPAVPRVWEKFYGAIVAKLEEEPNERKRKLGQKALEVAERKGQALAEHRRADIGTELAYRLFDRLVYPKIREAMGLDRCLMGFSGAAPITAKLLHVFTGFGIPISEVYGMTESSTIITLTPLGRPRVGTVGVPIPGSEVTIAEDGEICFRGPHVTPGYLNRPEATAEAIDDDGWFHTGDLGAFDDAGYLRITGRKKELIITAAGKNLSPNNIEEAVKSASPLISQVCAIGDERAYISALVVLDPDALPAWCENHDVVFESFAQASQHPAVREVVQAAVDAANQQLARVEQVKRFTILDEEWTPESAELTPTMKLKRAVIHERHAGTINAMYA